ncbi:hypothetical protein [Specibacter cremeus]|uniref:hypothetical protein n=1 Tax=Specibacter cremeus TaxID=1629051 RepID=UPI000F7AA1FB|nr:hypothetical protein [Specibacter cremeus]
MDKDFVLLHQVHPVKLAFDVAAAVASNVLLWRHRPCVGLVVRFAGPMVGSAVVLRFADVGRLRRRPAGQYIVHNMPPTSQFLRLAGDAAMAYGSWRRNPKLMAAGLGIIVLGWSRGIFSRTFQEVERA